MPFAQFCSQYRFLLPFGASQIPSQLLAVLVAKIAEVIPSNRLFIYIYILSTPMKHQTRTGRPFPLHFRSQQVVPVLRMRGAAAAASLQHAVCHSVSSAGNSSFASLCFTSPRGGHVTSSGGSSSLVGQVVVLRRASCCCMHADAEGQRIVLQCAACATEAGGRSISSSSSSSSSSGGGGGGGGALFCITAQRLCHEAYQHLPFPPPATIKRNVS